MELITYSLFHMIYGVPKDTFGYIFGEG